MSKILFKKYDTRKNEEFTAWSMIFDNIPQLIEFLNSHNKPSLLGAETKIVIEQIKEYK